MVRSQETYTVRRQVSRLVSEEHTEWMGVTTLFVTQASPELVVRLGHARWDIENYGFNELVNGWHADHVYKHHPHAIEAFASWPTTCSTLSRYGMSNRNFARAKRSLSLSISSPPKSIHRRGH